MIKLRQMIAEDVMECTDIIRQTMGGGWAESYRQIMEKETFDGDVYRQVVMGEEKILGFGGVFSDGITPWMWVSWFAVRPKYQRNGIGKMLIDASIAKAQKRGFRRIYVKTYTTPRFQRCANVLHGNGVQGGWFFARWTREGGYCVFWLGFPKC